MKLKIDKGIFNIPNGIAVTGRVKSWLNDLEQCIKAQGDLEEYDVNDLRRLPVSCTVYVVDDTMDESENSIEDSWRYVSYGLRNGAGVAVHLSNLRPSNTPNGKGLVSSGVVSFAQIYSKLNEILRRGGTYKNGAVVIHLDYDHPDLYLERKEKDDPYGFINAPRELLPWAKRCINVDEGVLDHPHLDKILESVIKGDCFLVKKQYKPDGTRLYHNVCVSGDNWISTSEGPKQVKELIGKPFSVLLNNETYNSTNQGFWSNGIKPVFKLSTKEGYYIEATGDHKVQKADNSWVELQDLKQDDLLKVNNLRDIDYTWSGTGNFEQGWLLGNLLGDGTFAKYKNSVHGILRFWGENRLSMLNRALEFLNKECQVSKGARTYTSKGCDNTKREISSVTSKGLALLADNYGLLPIEKSITDKVESASSDFCKGFLQGYYDADGTVSHGTKKGSGRQISITSIKADNLRSVQRILLRFGIHSKLRLEKYNGEPNLLPDGKGGLKLYPTKKASRLDISGSLNMFRFKEVIGFSQPEKAKKLDTVLDSFKATLYSKSFTAKVSSIEYSGLKEVFDCTINNAHAFDANGLIAHNCQEILISPRGTCLLAHVNLGQMNLDDDSIYKAFTEGMEWLCKLHACTGVHLGGHYKSPEEDRQVGLGVIGLANLLAIEGIKYAELVEAMEFVLTRQDGLSKGVVYSVYVKPEFLESKAYILADKLYTAMQEAGKIARKYNMERAFTVAPTASCSFNHQDKMFYTTTPEIAPPVNTIVERDSETMGVVEADYHPDCEIAVEVGWDVYYRLNKAWQLYMDHTGLAHAISTNWWSDVVKMDKEFLKDWLASPLKSLYYAWQVVPDTQDKSKINTSDSLGLINTCSLERLGDNEETAYNTFCSACAE